LVLPLQPTTGETGTPPFDPDELPFDPEELPLDPEEAPFDPAELPFDPAELPFDPEEPLLALLLDPELLVEPEVEVAALAVNSAC
jgi:hypothetical protein